MERPVVFADFHNADRCGRLRLNCAGTDQDLSRHRIELREGMRLTLSDDELEVEGGRPVLGGGAPLGRRDRLGRDPTDRRDARKTGADPRVPGDH